VYFAQYPRSWMWSQLKSESSMVPVLKTELMFLVIIDNDFIGLIHSWASVSINMDGVLFEIGTDRSDIRPNKKNR